MNRALRSALFSSRSPKQPNCLFLPLVYIVLSRVIPALDEMTLEDLPVEPITYDFSRKPPWMEVRWIVALPQMKNP